MRGEQEGDKEMRRSSAIGDNGKGARKGGGGKEGDKEMRRSIIARGDNGGGTRKGGQEGGQGDEEVQCERGQ